MDAKTMSDNSRRTVCRLAFLLLCVFPAALVVYRIWHPVSIDQWQQSIKANLGVTAQIGSVETPLPFVTVLKDVRLVDPELEQLVHLEELKIHSGATHEVIVEQPIQLSAPALASIGQRLREGLIRTHAASSSWKITLLDTTITHPGSPLDSPLRLTPVEITVLPYPDLTIANVEAKRVDDSSGNLLRFSVQRAREDLVTVETFKLETGTDAYLPCWVLHDIVPELESFGPMCHFSGFAQFEKRGNQWSGTLPTGQFANLALQNLTRPFGRQIHGLCDARVENCRVVDGKIQTLEVELSCEQGSIDLATGNAAVEHLNAQWAGNQTQQPFTYLQLNFAYKDGYVFVKTQDGNGVVATLNQQPLLQLPGSEATLPIHKVAAFLESNYFNDTTIGFLDRFQISPNRIAEQNTVPDGSYR